jgi:hypothetical protein
MIDEMELVDDELRRWGRRSREAAARQAPEQIGIAAILERRQRRPILPILAASLVMLSIGVAVATLMGGTRRDGAAAGSGPCQPKFVTNTVINMKKDEPGRITINLRYVGKVACTISASPPQLRLINRDGMPVGPQTPPSRISKLLVLRPGDTLNFTIDYFLHCIATPETRYTLLVYLLQASHPRLADGIAVQVLHAYRPVTDYCRPDALGLISAPLVH